MNGYFASTWSAIVAIMRTASSGYAPRAVSPESITASVPSRIAFATSVTSARVGRGEEIIDSSICVAVTTGFEARFARCDHIFLRQRHLFERDLDAEVAARDHDAVGRGTMSSMWSSASCFSIFAITGIDLPAAAMCVFDAQHVLRRAHERNGDPVDAVRDPEVEVLEIAIGHRFELERSVRIVDSLPRAQLAAVSTTVSMRGPSMPFTRSAIAPSAR